MRRLSFGELQHRDQDRHGMECRLRKMSRRGQRARQAADANQYPESFAARLCTRERYLHPVPFAGSAAEKSHRQEILRLARRLSRRTELGRLLEAGGTQAWRA